MCPFGDLMIEKNEITELSNYQITKLNETNPQYFYFT